MISTFTPTFWEVKGQRHKYGARSQGKRNLDFLDFTILCYNKIQSQGKAVNNK